MRIWKKAVSAVLVLLLLSGACLSCSEGGSADGGGEPAAGPSDEASAELSGTEETAAEIDQEIKRIMREAYEEAERILRENMEKLHFIAGFLFKNEIMEEEQFRRAMEEDGITFEELETMVAEKRKKSEEENKARAERLAEEEKKREEERARENARHPSKDDPNPYSGDDHQAL